jgi:hypothetical protein
MATIVITLLPDGAIPVDQYEETEEGSSCPLPTQDEDLNAENKQDAIDEADYREPNTGSAFRLWIRSAATAPRSTRPMRFLSAWAWTTTW